MFNQKNLDHAIAKTIGFIVRAQNSDGSFDSHSSTNAKFTNPETFITTFYASLILFSISHIDVPKLQNTKNKASKFLLSEQNREGTYNYWAKSFSKYKSESCPDDLDDTSCALSALLSLDKSLVTEAKLAKITKVLINSESKVGGPYYTWIVPKYTDTRWKDVDLAVNANVGSFLSLLGITLPNIEKMIEESIFKKSFISTYYPDYSTLYFISRFYKGKSKEELIRFLLEENSKTFNNSLECAQLGISLLNLGVKKDAVVKNVKYLLSNQKKDGVFGTGTFIIERTFQKNVKRFSGSEAFTAALALELMTRYSKYTEKKESMKVYDNHAILKKEISGYASEIISKRFNKDIAKQFDLFLEKIVASDTDGQILLHPLLFVDSLKKSFSKKENEKYLLNLGVASIFGWMAYTIFDNISDEKKDLDKLSLALICNRELGKLFYDENPSFQTIFQKIMDRVDYAIFYEYKYARLDSKIRSGKKKIYPNADFVAEKSIAHSLGPLAVLYKLGFSSESKEFQNLLLFYQNYLVARQLNDDAHDWEEDLSRGQINYVGEILLKDFEKKYKKPADYPKDQLKLRKLFWEKTIEKVCAIIQNKITEAKNNLNSLSSILDRNYLEYKLAELNRSAKKAIEERDNTKQFLNAL